MMPLRNVLSHCWNNFIKSITSCLWPRDVGLISDVDEKWWIFNMSHPVIVSVSVWHVADSERRSRGKQIYLGTLSKSRCVAPCYQRRCNLFEIPFPPLPESEDSPKRTREGGCFWWIDSESGIKVDFPSRIQQWDTTPKGKLSKSACRFSILSA